MLQLPTETADPHVAEEAAEKATRPEGSTGRPHGIICGRLLGGDAPAARDTRLGRQL